MHAEHRRHPGHHPGHHEFRPSPASYYNGPDWTAIATTAVEAGSGLASQAIAQGGKKKHKKKKKKSHDDDGGSSMLLPIGLGVLGLFGLGAALTLGGKKSQATAVAVPAAA